MTRKIRDRRIDWLYYGHYLITVVLMFGFGYLPPLEPLTVVGMQVLGVFAGLIYSWTTIGLIWPSLLGLIALGMTEYTSINQAIISGFSNNMVLLCIFLLTFVAIMESTGINTLVANWLLSRKIAVGRPWVLTSLIFLAAFVLGGLVSVYASLFMMWNIAYQIFKSLGYKRGDKYTACVLIGIVYIVTLGYAILPFRPVQLLLINSLEKWSEIRVDFLAFTFFSGTLAVLSAVAYVLFCKYIIRPDLSLFRKNELDYSKFQVTVMTRDQKIALFFLIMLMVFLFIPSFLPKDWVIYQLLKDGGTVGCLVLLIVLACSLRLGRQNFVDFSQMAQKGLVWDIIIMFAALMPVADALNSETTGFMPFLLNLLTPLFQGLGPVVFTLLLTFVAIILGQLGNTMVLAVLFGPIVITLAEQLQFSPTVVIVILAHSLNIGYLTPAASAEAAIIHANKTWIKSKDAYLFGSAIFVITLIICLGVGVPLGFTLFK